jgi:hypothetical protein
MNLRDIFVSISCCTAVFGLGFCKHLQAGEIQSQDETVSRTNERCTVSIAPAGKAVSCERIGGHLRVEFAPRIPSPPGFGRPGASPAAVRTDGGSQSSGHLYLPGDASGLDPFRR